MPPHPDHLDPDEVDLRLIEAHLSAEDPHLAGRFDAFTNFGTWPVRALTVTWIAWTAILLAIGSAAANSAALVLAMTSVWAYPVGMAVGLRLRRTRTRRGQHGLNRP